MTFLKIKYLISCTKQEIKKKIERLYMKEIPSIYHLSSSFPLLNAIKKTIISPERKFVTIFDSYFMCFTSNLNDERDSNSLASCVSGISLLFFSLKQPMKVFVICFSYKSSVREKELEFLDAFDNCLDFFFR